jgi:hypothetical protein
LVHRAIQPNDFRFFQARALYVPSTNLPFNYDRLLEHLLYDSFKNTFTETSVDEINRILESVFIIHVYGAIDEPPWKRGVKYRYGGDHRLSYLNAARSNIRIIHEGREENPVTTHVEGEILQGAKRVFFLGFGYDPDNLRMLKIPDRLKNKPQIFGTAVGLFPEEIERAQRVVGSESKIESCDCTELLRRHLV